MITTYTPQLLVDEKAKLGEGAFWDPVAHILYWVDIERGKIFAYDPVRKNNQVIKRGNYPSAVVTAHEGWVVAFKNGIHFLNKLTGEMQCIADPETEEAIRYNDGKCDPSGRFWIGTMHLETKEGVAKLFRIDHNLQSNMMLDKLTISNGIVWNSAKDKMYLIDTPTQKVMVFDYDNMTGDISNRQTAFTIPADLGMPDGMAIDVEDRLWICLYDGGCVGRFDAVTGELLEQVKVPAPKTTSCAFGGNEMRTLFITTAREGMSAAELMQYPESGGLFSVETNVQGALQTPFKG